MHIATIRTIGNVYYYNHGEHDFPSDQALLNPLLGQKETSSGRHPRRCEGPRRTPRSLVGKDFSASNLSLLVMEGSVTASSFNTRYPRPPGAGSTIIEHLDLGGFLASKRVHRSLSIGADSPWIQLLSAPWRGYPAPLRGSDTPAVCLLSLLVYNGPPLVVWIVGSKYKSLDLCGESLRSDLVMKFSWSTVPDSRIQFCHTPGTQASYASIKTQEDSKVLKTGADTPSPPSCE
ncbi:hypothetical protein PGTUg99_015548 [Puccinia graminis f. sp. tritici]|uniref:Uncharacterized protein n=1 Tax=Puccinia graminis f. sp. tritici TaxID=56615 RepID=A0A5B0SI13_PUCGR|nr:hypothetical protein PGTUg99_015548 [Puccinia graminis f. sp. tritici]